MKKFKLHILSILLLALSLSCHQESVKKKITNEWEYIGNEHNEGLAYIISNFKHHRGADLSLDEVRALNKKYGLEYIMKKYPNLTQEELAAVKTQIDVMDKYVKKRSQGGRTKSLASEIMDDAAPYLTGDQYSYISSVINLMEDTDVDIDQFYSGLNDIEYNAYNYLASSERPIVLTVIGIARNSAAYWEENYIYWETELNQIAQINTFDPSFSPRVKGEISWGVVGAADVAAGTVAGVATSVALVVPFVGWGFWGAVTGGSALITSGAATIMYALAP